MLPRTENLADILEAALSLPLYRLSPRVYGVTWLTIGVGYCVPPWCTAVLV